MSNDNRDLIGPGQMQVYPSGIGSMPLPFLRENAIAEFVLPNGIKVAVSIDRAGQLLVWSPTGTIELVDQPDTGSIRVTATPKK